MREIKFRVWDKISSQFFVPVYEDYKGNLKDLVIALKGDLFMRTSDSFIHESMFPDRYKLNQYTGFKDIYYKEIYENDIVHVWDNGDGVIIFEDGMWKVEFKRNYREKVIKEAMNDWIEDEIHDNGFEVIGNMYENPELINEKLRFWNGNFMIYVSDSKGYEVNMPQMQFTGLKDKNGTDIYEDDFLSYGHGIIERVESSCVAGNYTWLDDDLKELHEYLFVVGNIYENPELLEA